MHEKHCTHSAQKLADAVNKKNIKNRRGYVKKKIIHSVPSPTTTTRYLYTINNDRRPMKFMCTKENFTIALNMVVPLTGRGAHLPILSNILIVAHESHVELTATNLSLIHI